MERETEGRVGDAIGQVERVGCVRKEARVVVRGYQNEVQVSRM